MTENELTPEQEQFQAWKQHPVTILFLQWLDSRREELKESWASAGFVNSHDVADVYLNAGAISACSVLKQIKEVEAEDLFGDE